MGPNERALFLYGFSVTNDNKYLDFRSQNLGPELTATLNPQNYTATEFMAEIKRAMEIADPSNIYTISLNRTVAGGTDNRMTVVTNGSYLDLLFQTGTHADNSPSVLMGFDHVDYTGGLSYTGSVTAGTILYPEFATFDYLGPDDYVSNDGVKNISAAGVKETLVFAQMFFIQGQWKYITNFNGRTQHTEWQNFLKYATKQLKFEFSPSINEDPDLFYQVTLETTSGDGNGMGFKFMQQRGEGLFRFYDTGIMKFRVIPV